MYGFSAKSNIAPLNILGLLMRYIFIVQGFFFCFAITLDILMLVPTPQTLVGVHKLL